MDEKKDQGAKEKAVVASHRTRGVHEAAREEQKQLGREQDKQVEPDRDATWKKPPEAIEEDK